MTRIIVRGHALTFNREKYRWESHTDRHLAKKVSASLDPTGPGGEDPHPPETAALIAEKEFKAKIIEIDPRPPYKEGVVY